MKKNLNLCFKLMGEDVVTVIDLDVTPERPLAPLGLSLVVVLQQELID